MPSRTDAAAFGSCFDGLRITFYDVLIAELAATYMELGEHQRQA